MYGITFVEYEFESLRDAKPLDDKYDTVNDVFIDMQKYMLKNYPELDLSYEHHITGFHHEIDEEIISCDTWLKKELSYISTLDCIEEEKIELTVECSDNHSDWLSSIGASIYEFEL